MTVFNKYFFFVFICLSGLKHGFAQEIENSADVYLEEYSDEFQENFFEALKQKGIENYDRAVNLLLKCKKLQPNNIAVTHELAKAYIADKKYSFGEEHALIAIKAEPKNMWYLQTLYQSLKKQGKNIEALKELVPYSDTVLKENLVKILFDERNYLQAQKLLKDIPNSNFKTKIATGIEDAVENSRIQNQSFTFSSRNVVSNNNTSALEAYKARIKFMIQQQNFVLLTSTAKDALEKYPSQPYFYYALGLAQNKNNKQREAVKTLESALDYLLDDYKLADNIYKELGAAYTALGNLAKARMYYMKVKSKI